MVNIPGLDGGMKIQVKSLHISPWSILPGLSEIY